jgi:hypothetical protein
LGDWVRSGAEVMQALMAGAYFSAESMLLIDAPRPSEEVSAARLIAS